MIPLLCWGGDMAYLTKIPLNPYRKGAQRLIQNPQWMHAAVERLLPTERSGRILWRLETGRRKADLLVLTPDFPCFEPLVEEAGWPGNESVQGSVASLDPLMGRILVGKEFHFRLKANTAGSSRSLQRATDQQNETLGKGKSVRVGHRTVGHQLDWFLRRTKGADLPWGFEVKLDPGYPEVSIVERDRLVFRKSGGVQPVTLDTATFEGVLRVTDADLFADKLLNGIGRAKAYGCGLLTVAPPKGNYVVEG